MAGVTSLAKLLFFVLVSFEAAARIGAGCLSLFSARAWGALERFGLGLLLGWMFIGTAFLGLALAGLFRPFILVGCPLVLLALTRTAWNGKPLIYGAARESGMLGATGLSLLGLACLPVVARMLTFESESTSYVYHLGAPWSFLLAGRALLENVPLAFHLPIPVDLSYGLSLVIGDDRGSKWQAASFLAAAAAVHSGAALRRGRRDSAWLGMLLVLTTGQVATMLGTSMNDWPAAALFIAGAVVIRGGGWMLGAMLLGSCVAAKLTCAPAVVLWLAFSPPPSGRRLAAAAGLALPLAPWLVKTLLATGNPVFPFASSILPAPGWGWMNERVIEENFHSVFRGSYGLAGMPGMWFGEMCREFMPVLLLLPGLLVFGPRRPAFACLLALLATFAIRHDGRYLLPAAAMTLLIAAEGVACGRDRFRKALAVVLSVYCMAMVPVGAVKAGFRWRDLAVRGDDLAGRDLPYQESVLRWLRENGCRRVLSVGEGRTYLFPCRLLYGGIEGETPLVWKIARETTSAAGIGKRLTQLGAECIVYNCIGAGWFATKYRVFPWDPSMARRYADYCKRYEVPVFRTEMGDFVQGGYFIYRVRRKPVPHPPTVILAAPGMDNLYGMGIAAMHAGRNREAAAILAATYKTVPDVGASATQLGLAGLALGDYRMAFDAVGPWIGRGMVDGDNLLVYGVAAMHLGRNDVAEKALRESLVHYPDQRAFIYTELAGIRVARAMALMDAGRPEAAADLIREGEELIAMTPVSGSHEKARRTTLAWLDDLRANLAFRHGDPRAAAGFLREALRICPDDASATRWKAMADRMDALAR